jgi:hypothetical protein
MRIVEGTGFSRRGRARVEKETGTKKEDAAPQEHTANQGDVFLQESFLAPVPHDIFRLRTH